MQLIIYYREGDAIKVFVRIRPPDSYDTDVGQVQALNVIDETSLVMNCKPDTKVFTFDQVADVKSTQVCLKDMNVWKEIYGVNG